jgi:hypothetical protein
MKAPSLPGSNLVDFARAVSTRWLFSTEMAAVALLISAGPASGAETGLTNSSLTALQRRGGSI